MTPIHKNRKNSLTNLRGIIKQYGDCSFISQDRNGQWMKVCSFFSLFFLFFFVFFKILPLKIQHFYLSGSFFSLLYFFGKSNSESPPLTWCSIVFPLISSTSLNLLTWIFKSRKESTYVEYSGCWIWCWKTIEKAFIFYLIGTYTASRLNNIVDV